MGIQRVRGERLHGRDGIAESRHRVDAATAARKAITAGVDMDMMSHYYDSELPALVNRAGADERGG